MVSRALRLAAVGCLTATVACTDSSAPDAPNPPATGPVATIVGGTNNQSGTRGAPLPRALQVRVTQDGAPVEGVVVRWETTDGRAEPDSSLTGVAGVASTAWVLSTVTGSQALIARVEGVAGSPLSFQATALSILTLTPDPGSDNQFGVAGQPLPMPLRVTVREDGVPAAGVVVSWRLLEPSVGPWSVSTSNTAGLASAALAFPARMGDVAFEAAVNGARAIFHASSASGQPSSIWLVQSVPDRPANWPNPTYVWAKVTDEYGNPVEGVPVAWSVQSGPLGISVIRPVTDADGMSNVMIHLTGGAGAGSVRASSVHGLTLDVPVAIGPAIPLVLLSPGAGSAFRSLVNGTDPAVDTIPVGGTMTWVLETEDLEFHEIESVGDPSFVQVPMGYGASGTGVTRTFTTPGTYRYTDGGFSPGSAIATIVVR